MVKTTTKTNDESIDILYSLTPLALEFHKTLQDMDNCIDKWKDYRSNEIIMITLGEKQTAKSNLRGMVLYYFRLDSMTDWLNIIINNLTIWYLILLYVQNLILAASDTSAATLTWALALLLNNQDILKKTQAELDKVVGKERQVEESDIKNLVYLQAILKEFSFAKFYSWITVFKLKIVKD